MSNNSIGDMISSARNNKKMSQQELADKLHVSRQAVSNWERKKTPAGLYLNRCDL